jgi:dTDP-4-amino-4,6-dideoxygalactose transaminase
MAAKTFTKSFTQQEPIPEAAIARAVEVLRGGRLHRYNTVEGEVSETALLEREFADYLGVPYALACASGGYALQIALRSAGLAPGDPVLCNAFTLTPVPGAIHNAGGHPVLVEIGEDYTVDLADLDRKAAASEAKYLLLSHMRGHIADMEAVLEICRAHGLTLIEDCAHTLGARWKGRMSGTFGTVACFSSQTYKHLNSGEGGFLTTADPELMARAVVHSGSYMLYGRHLAAPGEEVFRRVRLETANMSGRMDNLRAAILREQLRRLDDNCRRWNLLYGALEAELRKVTGLHLPIRAQHEHYVGSSLQFSLPDFGEDEMRDVVARCAGRGVELKWFGAAEPHGFTSRFDSWRFIDGVTDLPRTRAILATLLDLRIPLTFDEADCALIGEIVGDCVAETRKAGEATAEAGGRL